MTNSHTSSRSHPLPDDSPTSGPRRRTVVTATAASLALLPLGAATAPGAYADTAAPTFTHGIASGDPLPDGILLWTRVTPSPDATPGSGRGAPVEVGWEVAEDAGFGTVVASGSVTADAATDHTVKADVRGLRPATTYHFRFTAGGTTSPHGRTRTAPATGASPAGARFGVVSCAHWENGWFAAYRHLAERQDLDGIIHLGDYVYEYGSGQYPGNSPRVRDVEPRHETVTLADYRARHGHYRTDPDLRALHAAYPIILTWDDHEFANNAWSGGAGNHTPGAEGAWADRMRAAQQAYFEWLPVRPSVAGTTYRRLQFGKLADLHMLDLRSFRDQQPANRDEVDDPERTITGRAQLDWLKSGLSSSTATWKLIGSSVMASPVTYSNLPPDLLDPLAELLGIPGGVAANVDQWDGYTDDRRELLTHLRDSRIANTVFLTGDIHMHWANDVPVDPAKYPVEEPVATEFVVSSVTSNNLDDMLGVPPHTASLLAAAAVRGANKHVRWLDMDVHGYGVLDLTSAHAQMDYYALSDRADPRATTEHLRSYRALPGGGGIEQVADPVR